MKKTGMQKGITLIALIITIIILLILAVVTIGSIKDSNIITYAQNASKDYNSEKDKEESIIAGYESLIAGSIGENKVIYTKDGVPVPAGFKVLEGTKNDGLVIENISEGSQFVWIPVKNINNMVICQCQVDGAEVTNIDIETLQCSRCGENTKLAGRLYMTGLNENFVSTMTNQKYTVSACREPDVVTKIAKYDSSQGCDVYYDGADKKLTNLENAGMSAGATTEDFKEQLQDEFNGMVKSVAKYKGFYVGRYETSMNGAVPQSKINCTPINGKSWYEIYRESKEYSQSGVVSAMIWGCQWDAIMRFVGENDAKAKNKVTKGTLSAPYKTGGYEYSGTITYGDIIKKIYDLEGNLTEWTQEASGKGFRSFRGGSFNRDYSPCHKGSFAPETGISGISSRLTLYIE